jgi:hypothetical protein
MKINGGSTGPIRPDAARDARGSAADRAEQGGGAAAARVDSVEISEAGRAKAATTAEAPAARLEARAARLQDIRQRILGGAYDTDEVVAEVARRILDRGDLQPVSATEIG